ncbi:MAG: Ig-like domain-containing protein, partial [Lachnospiraceae bacterium]|nr:Ig-like domain-containing protein [Lachnospiraceae bacterium]
MISCNQTTMKIGDEYALLYLTYSGKKPNFKSSKSSIASVNTYGIITAKKAGTAKITAKVKGFEAYCFVTVLPTTIKLSGSSVSLYKGQTYQLKATTSTGHAPTFKSSKSSVATVEEDGTITAIKHGSAIIKVS